MGKAARCKLVCPRTSDPGIRQRLPDALQRPGRQSCSRAAQKRPPPWNQLPIWRPLPGHCVTDKSVVGGRDTSLRGRAQKLRLFRSSHSIIEPDLTLLYMQVSQVNRPPVCAARNDDVTYYL